ncbi:hypothetical protein AB0P17_01275 [Streptomyces sp. NPDC088124]|uniref:hypothetical protein n=1 Tax=Streptomyces sp. NPDC088124 TaxID=3154654 RepID=UPI0034467957
MASPESEFLERTADVVFELGPDGFRLTTLSLKDRTFSFHDSGHVPGPASYVQGAPPATTREGRREYDWQPAADAPAYLHLAWLLAELSEWETAMTEKHVTIVRVECPDPGTCDLLLLDGDTTYRVRVALAQRKKPLDFPGMYLLELFAEGRHRQYLAGPVTVDLREVL